MENFPPTLTHLKIIKSYNANPNIKLNNLPLNLTSLIIHDCNLLPRDNFLFPIDNLPLNLKILVILGSGFNYPVDNLPKTLTYLKLGNMFSHSIDNLPTSIINLPTSIINLVLNNNKTPSFENSKMLNLRYLELGSTIFLILIIIIIL